MSESIDEFRQPGQHVAVERRVRNQPVAAQRGADGSLMLKILRLFDEAGATGECRCRDGESRYFDSGASGTTWALGSSGMCATLSTIDTAAK